MGNEKICENESEEITVSVVMPVYNGEKYLNQAIESVLLQRKEISSIELLIVDDASTDSTPEIIKKYQKETPEIRYLRNKTNMGAARSRNYGVEEAKGRTPRARSGSWSATPALLGSSGPEQSIWKMTSKIFVWSWSPPS